MPTVAEVYYGSDAAATRKLLKRLEDSSHVGKLAAAMFRAQKASSRAKKYHGGIDKPDGTFRSYRMIAYDNKGNALKAIAQGVELLNPSRQALLL